MIQVTPLRPEDRSRWEVLARGYKTFYKTTLPSADYELAWRRLMAGPARCTASVPGSTAGSSASHTTCSIRADG